jgi:hypothetical protein
VNVWEIESLESDKRGSSGWTRSRLNVRCTSFAEVGVRGKSVEAYLNVAHRCKSGPPCQITSLHLSQYLSQYRSTTVDVN